MRYKIVKYQDVDQTIVYTLCSADDAEDGEIILIFEADSYEQASFIKNQFLHFEPYKPFDACWIAETRHIVSVSGVVVADMPYEYRTLLVIAPTEAVARQKIEAEAIAYGAPYKNGDGQDVIWRFDKIISIAEADFFSTIDLYRGSPVEIKSRRSRQASVG